MLHTHVLVTIAEPLSPTGIHAELGFDGYELDTRGNGVTAPSQVPSKYPEPAPGAFAVPDFEATKGEKQHAGQNASRDAIPISALFALVGRSDIRDDNGVWWGTDWVGVEKKKINAIKDPNVRDAIFVSHVQKEPELDVRRTKRLLVTMFTSDSNGWSEPRGYWADWVRLEHGSDAGANPQELFKTIDSGIQNCRKFVCFLSPEYLKSWACLHELALAAQLQKDIVVARVQDVGRISFEDVWRGVEKYEGQIDKSEVELAVNVLTKGLVWHIFDWSQLAADVDAFERQVGPFLEATDSNYADWDFHARLGVRCSEWMLEGKAKKLLLHRDDVETASTWAMRRLEQPKQRPQPSAEHLAFIAASERKERKRRQKVKRWYTCGLITSAVVAAALIALSIFFLTAKHDAQENERLAVAERRAAQASEARAVEKERQAVAAQLEAQASEARAVASEAAAVEARDEAKASEARAVQAKMEAEASEAKAVRQLRRSQVGQLMSTAYVTATLPDTRLKVAATAVELAKAASPDSHLFAMGVLNKALNDFRRLIASRHAEMDGFRGALAKCALSWDARWLASGAHGDALQIDVWDLKSTTRQHVALQAGAEVRSIAFWGKGVGEALLVAVDWSLAVWVWNLTSLQTGVWDESQVEAPVQLKEGSNGYFRSFILDVSHSGSSLLLCRQPLSPAQSMVDGPMSVLIWDFNTSAAAGASMVDMAPQEVNLFGLMHNTTGWDFLQWQSAIIEWGEDNWVKVRFASSRPYIILQAKYKVVLFKRNTTTDGWETAVTLDVSNDPGAGAQVVLSPDLHTLATQVGSSVHVWKTSALVQAESSGTWLTLEQATGGAVPLVLPLPEGVTVAVLEFSPDGRYLLAPTNTGSTKRVWDLYGPRFGNADNLPLIYKVAFESTGIANAAFASASSHLITQSGIQDYIYGTVDRFAVYTYVWDVSKSPYDWEVVKGKDWDWGSLALTPDGRYLASFDEGRLTFYDVETGSVDGSSPIIEAGRLFGGYVLGSFLSFSPDGQHCMVISGALDGPTWRLVAFMHVYDISGTWESRKIPPLVELTLDVWFYDAQFTSTGAFVLGYEKYDMMLVAYRMDALFGGQAQQGILERIVVFDLSWVTITEGDNSTYMLKYQSMAAFACAPDDSYVAIVAVDYVNLQSDIILINLPGRAGAQATGPYPTPFALTSNHFFAQRRDDVYPLAFSPTLDNGKQYLVWSNDDKDVIFWDVTTSPPSMARRFRSQDDVYSFAFSADGQFLAMGSWSGVEIFGLACMGSSGTLPSFTLTSQIPDGLSGYLVAFHRNARLPAKIVYGSQLGALQMRTVDTSLMKEQLTSIRSSAETYSADEIGAMTGVIEDIC